MSKLRLNSILLNIVSHISIILTDFLDLSQKIRSLTLCFFLKLNAHLSLKFIADILLQCLSLIFKIEKSILNSEANELTNN